MMPTGLKPETSWSEVRSAYRSAMWTLHTHYTLLTPIIYVLLFFSSGLTAMEKNGLWLKECDFTMALCMFQLSMSNVPEMASEVIAQDPTSLICWKYYNQLFNGKDNYILSGEATLSSWFLPPFCLFVLRFYRPVNSMGSFRARSLYWTTLLLGRLSPLSG